MKTFVLPSRAGSPALVNNRYNPEAILKYIEVGALYIGLAVVVTIVLLSAAIGADGETGKGLALFFRAMCVGMLVAISAVAVGCALGFLFGIPRLLQSSANDKGSSSNEDTQSAHRLRTNTSFEEISDWLTKIIIGLSLVQFQTIMHYFFLCATFAANFVTNKPIEIGSFEKSAVSAGAPVAFYFGLIISCLLLSCLFIYVQTRTRISSLFQDVQTRVINQFDSEFVEPVTRPIAVAEEAGKTPGTTLPVPQQPTQADLLVANTNRADLISAKEIGSWGASQARLGNLQAAEDALRDALQRAPGDAELLLRLAEVRRVRQSPGFADTALELITKAPDNAEAQQMAFEAQLDVLYSQPPGSFEKSLELAERLKSTRFADEPYYHLRRACALGQKYSFETNRGGTDLERVRAEALQALKIVQQLTDSPQNPVHQDMVAMLEGKSDDDLKDLRNLPEFQQLLKKEQADGDVHD